MAPWIGRAMAPQHDAMAPHFRGFPAESDCQLRLLDAESIVFFLWGGCFKATSNTHNPKKIAKK